MTQSEFFFDIPLYSSIEIDEESATNTIFNTMSVFDGYNPWKRVESTFTISQFYHSNGVITVTLKCKRTDGIFNYFIIWDKSKNTLMKIGQYPSIADFHISELKQYKNLLSNEKLKEFTRAIGLAANGVGIGSFVYLRRIFEHLIREAYDTCKNEGNIQEKEYLKARMDKKIEMLSSHLPNFLVQNKSIYSILSKGIHELDEKTCLAHFDTLRIGIEIILDEKLDELRKKEKVEKAKKQLSKLKTDIKNS